MSKLIHYSGPAGSYILPSGYTRLTYIQSTGTAAIDTGMTFSATTMREFEVMWIDDPASGWIYGANSGNLEVLLGNTKDYLGGGYIANPTWQQNVRYTIGISTITGNMYCRVNQKIPQRTSTGSANGKKEYLFGVIAASSSNTVDSYKKWRLYNYKIWDNGVLVKDYVPVQKTDGIIGVLNLVDNSFSTCAGLIAGPECPQGFPTEQYCQVEWLGFDKGKNVNTGINIDANQQLVMKMGIRYGSVGIGTRDLFGYSGEAGGYMGVTTGNTWEIHGSLSRTSDDIYRYNDITWTNSDPYTGNIWLGSLGLHGYSTRDKYISYVNITVAGVHKIHWVACYRRSDMMPGFYDLVSRIFKEMPGFPLGPSITFGWGEVINSAPNSNVSYSAIPHNISNGEGRMGEKNGSFDFSGTNAYLNTNGQVTGKTYMGWFYTASKPAREVFFADSASGIAFGTYHNGTQAIVAAGTSAKIMFTLNTWNTGWNHIAVVKSDNGPQLYINGIAQTATSSTNVWTHNGGLWIGARSTFDGNFSGKCQDFKVFDTALNQAQIQQEM